MLVVEVLKGIANTSEREREKKETSLFGTRKDYIFFFKEVREKEGEKEGGTVEKGRWDVHDAWGRNQEELRAIQARDV